jgi:hypothetical protein
VIDELLENAEKIEKAVPFGAYEGPPPPEVKAMAEEVLRSIQGMMGKRQLAGYEEPKLRVSPRGTVQMIWDKPWAKFSVACRAFDNGGSVGSEQFAPGNDMVPDPELMGSQPLGHVVEQLAGFLSR